MPQTRRCHTPASGTCTRAGTLDNSSASLPGAQWRRQISMYMRPTTSHTCHIRAVEAPLATVRKPSQRRPRRRSGSGAPPTAMRAMQPSLILFGFPKPLHLACVPPSRPRLTPICPASSLAPP